MARHLVDDEFKAAALHDAVYGLREKRPLSSASVAFVPWQKWLTLGLVAVVILALVFATIPTLTVLTAVCTAGYIATLADRLLLFSRGLARDAIFTVDDDEARAVPEQDLPTYTVLVPAYN